MPQVCEFHALDDERLAAALGDANGRNRGAVGQLTLGSAQSFEEVPAGFAQI